MGGEEGALSRGVLGKPVKPVWQSWLGWGPGRGCESAAPGWGNAGEEAVWGLLPTGSPGTPALGPALPTPRQRPVPGHPKAFISVGRASGPPTRRHREPLPHPRAGWTVPCCPISVHKMPSGPQALSLSPAPRGRPPGWANGSVLSTEHPRQAWAPVWLRGMCWLGGSQASWVGIVVASEGLWMVGVIGMPLLGPWAGELPWTRGGAGAGEEALRPAQGRTRLVAIHSWRSGCRESPPPVSRSPSQSGQRGPWPVKSCALCQHVSQPSRLGEPPRRRVPINSPAWPSPTSGAREAHRQHQGPERLRHRHQPRGRAGAEGPLWPPRDARCACLIAAGQR